MTLIAGSFYLHYPRHRTLISINKRNTGMCVKHRYRDWGSGSGLAQQSLNLTVPTFFHDQEALIRSLVSVMTGTLWSVMMRPFWWNTTQKHTSHMLMTMWVDHLSTCTCTHAFYLWSELLLFPWQCGVGWLCVSIYRTSINNWPTCMI